MSRLLDRVREAPRAPLQPPHRGGLPPPDEAVRPPLRPQTPTGTGGEVSTFASHPAAARRVAASTQGRALSALTFLYGEVLDVPTGWVDDGERAGAPRGLPAVFTREEVRAVLGRLRGEAWPMASLLVKLWTGRWGILIMLG